MWSLMKLPCFQNDWFKRLRSCAGRIDLSAEEFAQLFKLLLMGLVKSWDHFALNHKLKNIKCELHFEPS